MHKHVGPHARLGHVLAWAARQHIHVLDYTNLGGAKLQVYLRSGHLCGSTVARVGLLMGRGQGIAQ